jgi:spermidine synthase
MTEKSSSPTAARDSAVLIVAIFIAGLCSIVYELLIGSTSSYFLGDSIKQFSLTIGIYMAAMGLGAFLSRLIKEPVLPTFIAMEILLALAGGLAVPSLYLCYSLVPDVYQWFMLLLVLGIGTLIGFEIPLLTRLLERHYTLKINISNVLGVDYLGALTATLLFPFVLLPFIGTLRSGLLFGIVNMAIAFLMLRHFGHDLAQGVRRRQWFAAWGVLGALVGGFFAAPWLTGIWSQSLYDDRILLETQTPYQRLVLTRYRGDVRLFIDGNLQFSSRDEYRYHESLVIPAMEAHGRVREVLVMGGGDGLALKQILKYDSVRSITLVDLDPEMTRLGRENPLLRELNDGLLDDPRVTVVNADAMRFVDEHAEAYDVIFADLPDPNNVSLSRLYSREFYRLIRRRLRPGGIFVTQATSPYYARDAFWCIHESVTAADFTQTTAYHAYIPSFGDWGFQLATDREIDWDAIELSVPTQFLNAENLPTLTQFPADSARPAEPLPINTLDEPNLLEFYLNSWRYWR